MMDIEPYVQNFYSFAKKKLGFEPDAAVDFISDPENAKNPLGKTAYYNPSTYKITIYIDGRHLKDILRSISHELVHHAQNCRGDFDVEYDAGEGYAQKDPHLRKMEKEAYLLGSGIHFRDWEDQYKLGEQVMKEWKKAEHFEIDEKLLKEEKKPKKEKLKKKRVIVVKEKKEKQKNEDLVLLEKKEAADELKESFNTRHQRLNESLMNKWLKK